MDFVFDDVFENNQLIKCVPEPYTINHFPSSPLDTFSTFIDSERTDFLLFNGDLHLGQHQRELILTVILKFGQVLLTLDLHSYEALNLNTGLVDFELDHLFFFLKVGHTRLHDSFIFH